MSIRSQIPAIEGIKDDAVVKIVGPMKTMLESMTGRLPNNAPIKTLGPTASLAGCINKINEIINRLQA